MIDAFLIYEAAANSDVRFRSSYSGRAMYGRQCVGVVGSMSDIAAFFFRLGQIAEGEDLPGVAYDNMGRDFIAYFPRVEPDPDLEDEK